MFSSVVRFFKGSMLAAVLLAGLVGLAAGGALVLAGTNVVSTASQRASNDQGEGLKADMKAVVAKCKAALPAGQHGIGKCVSAIANKHGKAASAAPKGNKDSGQDQDTDEIEQSSNP